MEIPKVLILKRETAIAILRGSSMGKEATAEVLQAMEGKNQQVDDPVAIPLSAESVQKWKTAIENPHSDFNQFLATELRGEFAFATGTQPEIDNRWKPKID